MNEQILDLWRNTDAEFRGGLVPKFVMSDHQPLRLMFLGLNPAFPKRPPEWLSEIGLTGEQFGWDQSGLAEGLFAHHRTLCQRFAMAHHFSRYCYPKFFRRLWILTHLLGESAFNHVDLFLSLETNLDSRMQQWLTRYVSARWQADNSEWERFALEQLRISLQLVASFQPQIIIGVYAGATQAFITNLNRLYPQNAAMELKPVRNDFLKLKHTWIALPGVRNSTRVFSCPDLPNSKGNLSIADFKTLCDALRQSV